LDFSFIPIKHFEERIQGIQAMQQSTEESTSMHEESEEGHLSIRKGETLSTEDAGFDCSLQNIMDE
jgi:hypothetical protein